MTKRTRYMLWWPVYDFAIAAWYRCHCCIWDHHSNDHASGWAYVPELWRTSGLWRWDVMRPYEATMRVAAVAERWTWVVVTWIEQRMDPAPRPAARARKANDMSDNTDDVKAAAQEFVKEFRRKQRGQSLRKCEGIDGYLAGWAACAARTAERAAAGTPAKIDPLDAIHPQHGDASYIAGWNRAIDSMPPATRAAPEPICDACLQPLAGKKYATSYVGAVCEDCVPTTGVTPVVPPSPRTGRTVEDAVNEATRLLNETSENLNPDNDRDCWFLVRITKILEAISDQPSLPEAAAPPAKTPTCDCDITQTCAKCRPAPPPGTPAARLSDLQAKHGKSIEQTPVSNGDPETRTQAAPPVTVDAPSPATLAAKVRASPDPHTVPGYRYERNAFFHGFREGLEAAARLIEGSPDLMRLEGDAHPDSNNGI